MKEKNNYMENENIEKLLTKLAIPGIIAMLISAIYNIVDTLFVGMLKNTSAIGAVTITFPMFMLISAIGQMFGTGSSSYISRLLGEKNYEKANQVASTGLFSSIIFSLVFTLLGILYLDPILKIFGASSTIIPYAKSYSKILLIGSLFTILNMNLNNMIRSEGNAKYSMYAIIIGAVANTILDPIFIFALNLGVDGAAIATVLGQFLSTTWLIKYYLNKKSIVKISISYFSINLEIYSQILKIGIATFVSQSLASISMGMLNFAASYFGDYAVAAIGIAIRIFCFPLYIIIGHNQGFQPIAGYNYGAKEFKRLKNLIYISIKRNLSISMISAILIFIFAPVFVSIFSKDSQVLYIGIKMLRLMSLPLSLLGFSQVFIALFQSLGKGKEALFLSLLRQGIFLIPAIYFFPKIWGLDGVIFAQPFADFATIIITAILAKKIMLDLNKEESISNLERNSHLA